MKSILNIIGLIFFSFIILSCASCISALDTEPCDTPIEKSVGLNDEFSITPLKDNYNVGDKIKLLLIVDNEAKLQIGNDEFKLFENTNEEAAKIYSGLEENQDLANLISNSVNSIDIKFGNTHSFGYGLKYNANLNKYILELEITFQNKRSYLLKDFSISFILGNKPNNTGENCHYYEHNTNITVTPNISFVVN